ncbi:hypothetical protein EST38_g8857 [Candolleomyces aberdarensis]|uniref:Uncharacterized protein n=1 Tax=Candolleomyces aberdarensis TaxID=2316362 RepID=A0A4Q2DBF6_9AGAR|nr:hypothetical protein EST38_g8857 [Candolleomyces aberdarensis]
MVAIRLLPFATAVFLRVLHTELVTARPLHKEGLSLRSPGSEAYDDGALALREPFDEDSLEEYFSREPANPHPVPPPTMQTPSTPSIPQNPPPANPPNSNPARQGGNSSPAKPKGIVYPPKPKGNPSPEAPRGKGTRSFDGITVPYRLINRLGWLKQDDIQDLVRRIILSEAEVRLNFPQAARPPTPPPVPGSPANNKPLPARPVTPPPPVPGKPANNKPFPAKPNGKRSFDEDDFVDLVQRIVLSDAEVELNFNPPPRVPGKPANNKPLPARPPPVPGKPANNKPLPAKPNGKRSFDEDEFERRAILEEIVEELLRRDYFVDMDLD